ncbi:MAG: hypothetical protein JSU86_07995 [Phycisphaerales bacterium]|nr:MAG: hypothetical protein JSU86_07995 [Phycisphaerales bacterium]
MTDRAKYWRRMLRAWERSGLSQAEFCRRRGLKAVTLAWWKRQLNEGVTDGRPVGRRRGPASRSQGGQAKFVEVALPGRALGGGWPDSFPAAVWASGYEIALPDGALIRLPGDFDPDKASQLIGAVASVC